MRFLMRLCAGALYTMLLLPPAFIRAACPEAVSVTDLDQRIDEARQSYAIVEYDAALAELLRAERLVGCTTGVLPATQLHRLYLTLGATHVALGQPTLAREALERALSLDPRLEWDKALGAKAEVVWLQLRSSQRERAPSRLLVPPLPQHLKLAIDGREAGGGETQELAAGDHFVQLRRPGDSWRGSWVRVPAGQTWRLRAEGDRVYALPMLEARPGRPRAGPLLVAGFGALTLASGALYLPAWADCRDEEGCEQGTETRGKFAHVVFMSSATATVLSAGFTWVLPALGERSDEREASRPRLHVVASAERLYLAVSGGW